MLPTRLRILGIEQVSDVSQVVCRPGLGFNIERHALAIGDIYGNFGTEYSILEDSVNRLAHMILRLAVVFPLYGSYTANCNFTMGERIAPIREFGGIDQHAYLRQAFPK